MDAAHFAAIGIRLHPEKLGWRILIIYPPIRECRRVLGGLCLIRSFDRDRGEPFGSAPLTPPGIRVTYHGGSTGLSVVRFGYSRKADRIEIVIAQCLLHRRVSRHSPESRR